MPKTDACQRVGKLIMAEKSRRNCLAKVARHLLLEGLCEIAQKPQSLA